MRGQPKDSVFSFLHVGPNDQTQFISLDGQVPLAAEPCPWPLLTPLFTVGREVCVRLCTHVEASDQP